MTQTLTIRKDITVAVYASHAEAERAVRELHDLGFDMKKLSIIGKDCTRNEDVVGYYKMGDRIRAWGTSGAFWGFVWSLVLGSAFFVVPGIGWMAAAGPVVASLVGALEGAVVVGGLGALGGALFSIGIPKDSILLYETQLRAGKYLVIAHDVTGDEDKAIIALEATRHEGMHHHDVAVAS